MRDQIQKILNFYSVTEAEFQSWSGPRKLAALRNAEAAERERNENPDVIAQRTAEGRASSLDALTLANRAERTAALKASAAPLPAHLINASALQKLQWLEKNRARLKIEREIANLNPNHPHTDWVRQGLEAKLRKLSS